MLHTAPKSSKHSGLMSQVVTRFAPSPTGYLHIGGARTALFSWAYAQNKGGKMLLRIEDTDRERSTEAAVVALVDGLKWLGLDWEGEPISQFGRAARHAEVAHELRSKYYLTYISNQELEPNTYHTISVEYLLPASKVIYRRGYYHLPSPFYRTLR